MTETALRLKVANAALAHRGENEADGTFKQIIDRYNEIRPLPVGYRMKYSDPWCAAFVSAVGAECCLIEIIFPECSCERMIALYKRVDRWQEDDNYNAQIGDLIMYDWEDSGIGDDRGEADHVGLIVAVTPYAFTVIEGNSSDAVQTRVVQRNSRYIRGFCCPDYASKCGSSSQPSAEPISTPAPAPSTQPPQATTFSMELPLLKKGSRGSAVKSMQGALIAHGCGCGPDGADGVFGDNTAAALRKYQSVHGLPVTTVCDMATQKSFWGVS